MRRLFYLLILVLFVSISASCVNASTDCERWFKAYREQLAHTRQLQRVAAAKRRAKLYAQRKLAGYVPKPKPTTVVKPGPRMTRKQTIHHFDLACGALPEDESDAGGAIAEEAQPPFIGHAMGDQLDLEPAGFDQMIAQNDGPPPFENSGPSPQSGGYPNYGPPVGGGGAPGGGGGGGTPGGGQTVPPPNSPPPPPPATPEVPEPGSLVLVLTGVAGAAGVLRRRFTA